ncbi:MAG: hypothetical protein IIC25_07990, partial [Chloroflexi bacterium]|nr:hypothetical protein [Chloroflexota bacterium]
MQTGVSYFSSRDLRHVRADLQEMADAGCTYVVHCFTETDLAFYRDAVRDIAAATREAGMEVWFDPWGLAGVFSGETFTRFPQEHPETWQLLSDGRRVPFACPNHPATREFLRGWVDACAAAEGEVLFNRITEVVERAILTHGQQNPEALLSDDTPVVVTGSPIARAPDIPNRVSATLGRPLERIEPAMHLPPGFPIDDLVVNIGLALG